MAKVDAVRENDQRQHPRFPVEGSVHIYWKDAQGQDRTSIARVVNASVAGAQLRTEQPFPVGLYISCNDPERGHCGHGHVCYCNREDGSYTIGLKFDSIAGA